MLSYALSLSLSPSLSLPLSFCPSLPHVHTHVRTDRHADNDVPLDKPWNSSEILANTLTKYKKRPNYNKTIILNQTEANLYFLMVHFNLFKCLIIHTPMLPLSYVR